MNELAGQRLRRARINSFLSLRELAGKSCVPHATIHRIERTGDGAFSAVVALAGALGLSLDTLTAPSACDTCDGAPPAGFSCQTCGANGAAVTL